MNQSLNVLFSNAQFIVIPTLNILLLLFAPYIYKWLMRAAPHDAEKRGRMLMLRFMSLILIALYLLALFPQSWSFGVMVCNSDPLDATACTYEKLLRLTNTGITLIISYFFVFIAQLWIVKKFGRQREIEGEKVNYHTYQSELLTLLVVLGVIIIAFLTVLNIWNVEDWLKQTSVLGGILIILFFTKDIWLPDNINGLLLLYSSEIEPGAVVRVTELDLLAVTLRTSLTQTAFRDLVQRHHIIIPNSRFRAQKIEILSQVPNSGLRQYQDFKIGYAEPVERVEAFLMAVWTAACESETAINPEHEAKVRVLDNGDHAVTWRLFYHVKNVYRLRAAHYAIAKTALQLAQQEGLGLNTPLTHQAIKP